MVSMFVGLAVFLAVLAFGLSFYLSPDDLGVCVADGSCKKVDAIVVVSGGDTKARVKEGVYLYDLGLADWLVFSGAAADKSGPSNAEEMRDIAMSLGVPDEKILMEGESNNTKENASLSKDVFDRVGIESIILVTSGYHQRRAYLEFREVLGEDFEIYNHPTTMDGAWSRLWWLSPRGWWLAISEAAGIGWFYVR